MFEPLPALIRMARAQQNLTQAQLARRAGVSRGTIAALEKGDENISLGLLMKVARALNLNKLYVGDLRPPTTSPDPTMISEACDAIIAARKVVDAAASARAELATVTEKLQQAAHAVPSSLDVDELHAYIERLRSQLAEEAATTAPAAAVATELPDA